MRRRFAALLCLAAAWSVPAQAQRVRELEAPIARVIAKVSDVWVKDQRYEAFHAELKGKYDGTPELGAFMQDEQWVTVISSPSMVYPGIFKGRGKSSMELKRGDIVDMRVSQYKDAKTYGELSEITRVLCKADAPDYEECAKANPLAWFDRSGSRLEQP